MLVSFILYLLRKPAKASVNSLLCRAQNVCFTRGFKLLPFLFNDSYSVTCIKSLKTIATDGAIDSLKTLLLDYNDHNRNLTKLILMPF